MTGLAVPTPANEVPGNFITGALWNSNVYNGLTFLLNRPLCSVWQNAAQSIPNASNTPIQFDSTNLDTYGGHSNVTNSSRYTAQVPGWYWVYGNISYSTASAGIRTAAITKNGSTVSGGFGSNNGNSAYYTTVSAAVPVLMAVGDYVETVAYQSSGAALNSAVGSGQGSGMVVWWIHA